MLLRPAGRCRETGLKETRQTSPAERWTSPGSLKDVKQTLYVLRHAKSSWGEPTLPDHERPLTPRGERACTRTVEPLRSNRILADHTHCSDSKRTRHTLQLIAPALGDCSSIRVEVRLSQAARSDLRACLPENAETIRSVLITCQNPAIQVL